MTTAAICLVGGACLLLAVVLPSLLHRFAISPPMVLVAVGLILGSLPLPPELSIHPRDDRALIEHITEFTVLVALMGVGLAIDRPLRLRSLTSWREWSSAWRLLGVAMPLTVASVALLGWGALGLAPATAILAGAVLSPTDPVLASDVQVGGPEESNEPPPDGSQRSVTKARGVRFALTTEAGLNDGLGLPFVYLAILVAAGGFGVSDALAWVSWDVVGRVLMGIGIGVVIGWLLGKIAFRAPRESLRMAEQGEPLLALAALLTAYGATELAHGYGFLAVFACAMTIRSAERSHSYHRAMHDVVERLERLMTLVVLLLLGSMTTQGLLGHLDLRGIIVGVALVFVIRPLTALLSLSAWPRTSGQFAGLDRRERVATAFFGVRGVASLFYAAYASAHMEVGTWMWSTVAFTIVLSVMVHGVTATPWMRRLDRFRASAAT